MSLTDIVKNAYNEYKSDVKYNTSLLVSELTGLLGSAGGAYALDSLNLNKYLSSVGGGIAGNYIAAVAGFNATWYLLNREKYSGKPGKFMKDGGEMLVKNLVPAAISYLVYSPMAAGLTYLGVPPEQAAFYSSLIAIGVFFVGSNIANRKIIKGNKANEIEKKVG